MLLGQEQELSPRAPVGRKASSRNPCWQDPDMGELLPCTLVSGCSGFWPTAGERQKKMSRETCKLLASNSSKKRWPTAWE